MLLWRIGLEFLHERCRQPIIVIIILNNIFSIMIMFLFPAIISLH